MKADISSGYIPGGMVMDKASEKLPVIKCELAEERLSVAISSASGDGQGDYKVTFVQLAGIWEFPLWLHVMAHHRVDTHKWKVA